MNEWMALASVLPVVAHDGSYSTTSCAIPALPVVSRPLSAAAAAAAPLDLKDPHRLSNQNPVVIGPPAEPQASSSTLGLTGPHEMFLNRPICPSQCHHSLNSTFPTRRAHQTHTRASPHWLATSCLYRSAVSQIRCCSAPCRDVADGIMPFHATPNYCCGHRGAVSL